MIFENMKIGGDGRQGGGSKGAQDTAIAGEKAQTPGV